MTYKAKLDHRIAVTVNGMCRQVGMAKRSKRFATVADDIIFQIGGGIHVEDRDCLLRGLTLYRSGREPDG